MKKFLIVVILFFAPIVLLAQEQEITNPFIFSGYFWVDQGYMQASSRSGSPAVPDREQTYQAGRFVLAADYIREFGNFYAKARGQFAISSNYTMATTNPDRMGLIPLDSYIELGFKDNNLGNKDGNFFNVRVGRFEGLELYHTGLGLDQYSDERRGGSVLDPRIPGIYELSDVRGYFRSNEGQAAVQFYFQDIVNFELACLFGMNHSQINRFGIRPIIEISTRSIFDLVPFKLVAGLERHTSTHSVEGVPHNDPVDFGYGGRIQLDEMPLQSLPFFNSRPFFQFLNCIITLGVNYTTKNYETKHTSVGLRGQIDRGNSGDITSYGFFLNCGFLRNSWSPNMFMVGGGYNFTEEITYTNVKADHTQPFFAFQYFTPIEGLSVKAVLGIGTEGNFYEDDVDAGITSFRVRLEYRF
jgi:hypothetical protein